MANIGRQFWLIHTEGEFLLMPSLAEGSPCLLGMDADSLDDYSEQSCFLVGAAPFSSPVCSTGIIDSLASRSL